MLLAAFVAFEMTGPVKTCNVVKLEVSPPMETEMRLRGRLILGHGEDDKIDADLTVGQNRRLRPSLASPYVDRRRRDRLAEGLEGRGFPWALPIGRPAIRNDTNLLARHGWIRGGDGCLAS